MKNHLLTLPPFEFHRGTAPLLVSMPHVGVEVPRCLRGRLSPECEPLGDTDWHLQRLYDFVPGTGASILAARYTRFAVDLNRPADDAPLYAGATTGLHPDILFDGTPAFRESLGLTGEERAGFLDEIWKPYHACIAQTLEGMKSRFGYAILLDAHSIASEIPRLFQGTLPDFNVGTVDGKSADASLCTALGRVLDEAPGYRLVINGRFKGGYITRHYGKPDENIHAVQLEIAQRTYMNERAPYEYLPAVAAKLQPTLQRFVATLLDWGRARYDTPEPVPGI